MAVSEAIIRFVWIVLIGTYSFAISIPALADDENQVLVVETEQSGQPDRAEILGSKRRGWWAQLIVEARGRRDANNFLGQRPLALDGLDRFDLRERPPRSKGYLTILFTNPQLPKVKWGFTHDFHATSNKPTGEWPFTVKASKDVKNITLSWRGSRTNLRSGWLIDLETGVFISTAPGGSYSYLHGDEDREFIFAIFQR